MSGKLKFIFHVEHNRRDLLLEEILRFKMVYIMYIYFMLKICLWA